MDKWVVASRYEKPVEFGEPDRFVVADSGNLSIERGRFSSSDDAKQKADELNRLEVQGPLDPAFAERRNRLKGLAPNFGSFYFEGPPAARWPVRPSRYLIRDGGVGWHAEESEELVETLADVEAAIAEDEAAVYSVIDLDTGEEIPFKREVSVTIGA